MSLPTVAVKKAVLRSVIHYTVLYYYGSYQQFHLQWIVVDYQHLSVLCSNDLFAETELYRVQRNFE